MDQQQRRDNARLLEAWLHLLEVRLEEAGEPAPDSPEAAARDAARHLAEERVAELERRGTHSGGELPLLGVARRFALSREETFVLVLALAPALDGGFRTKIGRFYRNVLLNYVSVDLCLRLLYPDRESRILGRRLFAPDATLQRSGLLRVAAAQDMPSRLLTDHEVSLPEELAAHLAGMAALPATAEAAWRPCREESLDPFGELVAAAPLLARWRAAAEALRGLLQQPAGGHPLPVLLFRGPFGAGRRMLATAFARSLGRPLRRVRLEGLHLKLDDWAPFVKAMLRDCLVQGQLPLFTDLEALEGGQPDDRERTLQRQILLDALEQHPGPVLLTTTSEESGLLLERPLWTFDLPVPGMEERELLWRRFLAGTVPPAPDLPLHEIADLYPLTGGLIRRAAEGALSSAGSRGVEAQVEADDVRAGIRAQLAHRMRAVAEYIEPHGRWEDVVVPEETATRLHEMVAYFRHRRTVWEDWDFRAKFSTLRGVSSLFYGPPGTGKSFTAGVVAAELGMDLFRVDLSQVVSKWIGETEKNLGRVFDEAARGHVVLFFDEADSLFTKRTEVSSSVDRYANLEVNYLLQRMERYEGVTILATNHENSLDQAFKRRLQFRIHFPQPEQEERRRLWQALLPARARVAGEVDWDYLAEAFDVSGGHIRNAIVRAAFRAADLDVPIDGELLHWAASAEYEEMGRLIRR